MFISLFSPPELEVKNGMVYVTGIPGEAINHCIRKRYKTSRVKNYIFTNVGRRNFAFYEFFALEVKFILQQIVNDRRLGDNVRAVHDVITLIETNTWVKDLNKPVKDILNFSKLNELTYKPLDFQLKFLQHYSQTVTQFDIQGLLLSAAAGSGKTFTTLALGHLAEADHIIVFSPLNAVSEVWEKNIKAVFKQKQQYWLSNSNRIYKQERIAVVHYEFIEKFLVQHLNDFTDKRTVIILDESHNFNELNSQRTQRFIQFCNGLPSAYVVLASGTPIKAISNESIPLLKTIDRKFTQDVENNFKRLHRGDAAIATEILTHRLNAISFTVEKSELNLEKPIIETMAVKSKDSLEFTLPEVLKKMEAYVKERVAYYAEHYNEYASEFWELVSVAETVSGDKNFNVYRANVQRLAEGQISKQLKYELIREVNEFEKRTILPNLSNEEKKRFKDCRSVVKYVELKILGEALGNVLGRERIRANQLLAKEIDYVKILNSTEKKTVIFSSYKEVVADCKKQLEALKLKPVVITGDNSKQLPELVEAFRSRANLNPLVSTYAMLSTAVPLVMADTMLLVNVPFRDYQLQQAISRIHRIGATTQVKVYIAVLDTGNVPNLTTRTMDILKWSQSQVKTILDIDVPFELEEDYLETNTGLFNQFSDW